MLGLPAYLTGNSKLVSVKLDNLTATYWTADTSSFFSNNLFVALLAYKYKFKPNLVCTRDSSVNIVTKL